MPVSIAVPHGHAAAGASPSRSSRHDDEVIERLVRIEAAIQVLSTTHATTNNAAASTTTAAAGGPIPTPPTDSNRRQRSSHFADEDDGHGSPHGAKFRVKQHGDASPSDSSLPPSEAGSKERGSGGVGRGAKFAIEGSESPSPSASPRAAAAAAGTHSASKAARLAFFGAMPSAADWKTASKGASVKCVWLSCAALGLTHVASNNNASAAVSIEDLLRANEMALHYVSMPSVTQAELADITKEFIRGHRDLKNTVECESVTFDTEVLEEEDPEDAAAMRCDRGPLTSLVAFRKALSTELGDESHSIHIFNYDPFVVQEAEVKEAADEDEDDAEAAVDLNTSGSLTTSLHKRAAKAGQKQWQAKNMGQFSILTQFNAALHTVSLVTPHLGADGTTYTLETHQCSLQTLYNACLSKDGYTKRPRGYVRIFRPAAAAPNTAKASLKHKFPLSLVDGRESRGMLSIALDISIAPHILGLGMLHGIVAAQIGGGQDSPSSPTVGHAGVALRGIPVTDVCTRLQLPVSTIVGSATRESLPSAASWYTRYLREVGMASSVDVGCVLITRRDDAEDGAVNIDEDSILDFFAETMACSTCAVLLAFNINVARNVKVVPDGACATHFAILLGFDRAKGIVALADVSVKRFGAVWHTTAERLFRALVGNGFLVVDVKGSRLAAAFDGKNRCDELASLARYDLPRRAPHRLLRSTFDHPTRNYSVTVLAKGLNALLPIDRLVTVEELIYRSGFHVSFMLSEHLPILATDRIANYYCRHYLGDSIHCQAVVRDGAAADEAAFVAAVEQSLSGAPDFQSVVLVNYAGASLSQYPMSWNGSFGGNLAMVVGYDSSSGSVYLEDSNPDAFYRQWSIHVPQLCSLMSAVDPIADRARGYLVLRRGKNPLVEGAASLDLRRAQSHHPFKNPVSSIATAIAFAVSEIIPGSAVASEEVIYSSNAFSMYNLVVSPNTTDVALALANDWAAHHPALKKQVTFTASQPAEVADTAKLIAAIAPRSGRVSVVLYDPTIVFPGLTERGTSAGLVARAAAEGGVVVADGSPTKHGEMWHRDAATFAKAVVGILHVESA